MLVRASKILKPVWSEGALKGRKTMKSKERQPVRSLSDLSQVSTLAAWLPLSL